MLCALLVLAATCPEGEGFQRPEQQQAACALIAQQRGADADRAALARLLEEPEFSRVRDRNANVLQVLWEQLAAWLKRFFETDEAASFAKTVPFAVLFGAFAIALAALLRFVRFRAGGGGAAREQAADAAGPLALKPAPEHLANARALLASSPREAVREALLALLSSLERKNLARPDRVKTNRELCAELPKRGADAALVKSVSETVDWYDRAFYSLQPIERDQAAVFLSSIERLV